MSRRRTTTFTTAALIAPAAILIGGCAPFETDEPRPTVTQNGRPQMQQGWLPGEPSPLERTSEHFVREAAMSNMAELAFSEVALERANDEQVRAFAQRMVQDHTMLQNDLAQVARAQNIGMPMGVTGMHQESLERLSQLEGPRFDVAYMQQMVEDHQRSVALHERQARETGNPAMQAAAQQALPVLRDHLREAQQILARLNGAGRTGATAQPPLAAPPAPATARPPAPAEPQRDFVSPRGTPPAIDPPPADPAEPFEPPAEPPVDPL